MAIPWHILFAQALSIQKQFNVICIAVNPNFNWLSSFISPVPMRGNMQYILISPPTFIVVIYILWKTTHIHDTKMRIHIWPFIWSGFAAVIETSPYKTTEPVIIRCSKFPPGLGGACPPGSCYILVGNISTNGISFKNSTSSHRATHFSSKNRLIRMFFVIIFNRKLTVVKTSYRYNLIDSTIYV